ncbi:MAG: hypothetical protein HY926_11990 [Elusimicrobia bacterium]|nr:hypothetical protein [Elusimicrobiota bacterium]
MSEKKCCTVEVTETDKGLRLELAGARIKDCLSSILRCCGAEKEGAGQK